LDARSLFMEAGLRPTRQRLAVLEALGGSDRPLTAQGLFAELGRNGRGAGLATVYRTLQVLSQAGAVRTFPAGEGEIAYKLCDPGHHHHLVCERCGKVIELPSCEVEGWAERVAGKRGFAVSSHQADIYGSCAECLKG